MRVKKDLHSDFEENKNVNASKCQPLPILDKLWTEQQGASFRHSIISQLHYTRKIVSLIVFYKQILSTTSIMDHQLLHQKFVK